MSGQSGPTRLTLIEKIERALTAAQLHGRGYAVTFRGAAAEAHVRGSVDGHGGRPNAAASFATLDEQESYQHGYETYYRLPRDRHGHVYEQRLFG